MGLLSPEQIEIAQRQAEELGDPVLMYEVLLAVKSGIKESMVELVQGGTTNGKSYKDLEIQMEIVEVKHDTILKLLHGFDEKEKKRVQKTQDTDAEV